MTETNETTIEQQQEQPEQPREMSLEELRAENARLDREIAEAEDWESPMGSLPDGPSTGPRIPARLPELPLQPTFEQTLAGTGDSGLEAILTQASALERNLVRETEAIEGNEDLSESAKQRRIAEVEERLRPRIAEASKAARSRALKGSEKAYQRSVPMPGGGTLASVKARDVHEVSAVRDAANDLVQKAEKALRDRNMSEHTKQGATPMKVAGSPMMDVLSDAFNEAMNGRGIESKVTGLAVLKACERLGVDFESVADVHREDKHFHALEASRRYQAAAHALPSGNRVSGPIFTKLQGHGAKTPGAAKQGMFQKKKRRPSWK